MQYFALQMEATPVAFKEPNRKLEKAWAMYDWANSAFPLSICTAIFPIYWINVTEKASIASGLARDGQHYIHFMGRDFVNTALYSYTASFAYLLVLLIQPLLSGISDIKAKKKAFLQMFCYLGALSCCLLYYFDAEHIWIGILFFITGMIGYAGSIVFYNGFLPEITTEDRYDKVSARGYSYGYLGSVILLIFNLALIILTEKPEDGREPIISFINARQATQIAFISVGLWWAGFAQFTFRRLPKEVKRQRGGAISKGFRELKKVFGEIRQTVMLKRFFISFFFTSISLQTVMLVASAFGSNEIKLPDSDLIAAVLVINLIGVPGSIFFSYLSGKIGNIRTLQILVFFWIFVCLFAYTIKEGQAAKFYGLGACVGLVMGGIQSLLRSTYAKLIPDNTYNHASYFSFYDVAEKLAIVLGTFIFGYINEEYGSMYPSTIALACFFVIGFLFMLRLKNFKGIHAG